GSPSPRGPPGPRRPPSPRAGSIRSGPSGRTKAAVAGRDWQNPRIDDPLRAPPPVFGPADALRVAEQVFGLSGSLLPLASERDLNFRLAVEDGRSFLLKLQNPADPPAVIEFQTMALRHVERVDPALPVMRVVPTRAGADWAE